MAAPRLLDKKTINAEVATQKLQEIKEGIVLYKKVDKMRDLLGEEEIRLERFRTESIAKVQQEIDTKIAERDSYTQGNEKLRQERFALQAPIDLKEEWVRVGEMKAVHIAWQEKLINDQVLLLADKEDVKTLSDVLEHRQDKVRESEKLSNRTLQEAQKKFSIAHEMVKNAEVQEKRILNSAKQREESISLREFEANIWENSLQQREMMVAAEKEDVMTRETALKTRYETFLKAQNYIKNKKK